MTEDQNLDQEVELYDDENEIMEAQGHDPKNAEAQSVASVDKAGEATGTAKKRSAPGGASDNTKQDPMPKTKAGLINAMYNKMSKAPKAKLMAMYNASMKEDFESEEEGFVAEAPELAYEADFSEDLNALINDEATLSEEFKQKAETIFEAAIKHKLSEEIDRLEAKYDEELAEEVSSTKSELVEKVDSYLNYVVEQWMADNQVAIQTGLRAEIAENFMEGLKGLFQESYIEVPESKVDLVDDLAETVEELEEKLNETTGAAIQMAEELEAYQRDAVIRESARGLAATEVEKLKSLVEDVDFEDAETFAKKVETVKESYFKKDVTESKEAEFTATEEDGESPVVSSAMMSQYLSALQKTSK
jgi:hypothetical protein